MGKQRTWICLTFPSDLSTAIRASTAQQFQQLADQQEETGILKIFKTVCLIIAESNLLWWLTEKENWMIKYKVKVFKTRPVELLNEESGQNSQISAKCKLPL